jgi:hypothetical protein
LSDNDPFLSLTPPLLKEHPITGMLLDIVMGSLTGKVRCEWNAQACVILLTQGCGKDQVVMQHCVMLL